MIRRSTIRGAWPACGWHVRTMSRDECAQPCQAGFWGRRERNGRWWGRGPSEGRRRGSHGSAGVGAGALVGAGRW